MHQEQNITPIEPAELIDRVQDFKAAGYRLVQICCTMVDDRFELTYSFDHTYRLVNLRMLIDQSTEIQSITKVYWPAFIFENEMKDLFGVKIKHMTLDFDGHFFKVSRNTPWNPASKVAGAEGMASEAAPEGEMAVDDKGGANNG